MADQSLPGITRKPSRLLAHGFVVVLIDAGALLLLNWILPGFLIDGIWAAILTALTIGLLNAFVWPVLARLTLRLTVLTLGFFGLILNALIVGAAMLSMPWLHINGLFEAVVITVSIAVITSLVSALLAIDEDSSWYLNVVRGQLRARGEVEKSEVPGVVYLEIDGLAHDVLRRAFANGNAPTLAGWVRDGSYDLNRWETDWSSQTGACQAGILHGNNHDMPAFRWWEKDLNKAIVTNHPRDAAEIERRQSDGNGLLANNGTSRANILSGDATSSMLTMSTVLERRGTIGHDYAAYFAKPYAVLKTAAFTVIEIFKERRAASRQVGNNVEPRIHRSRTYAIMRAWATVIQLDLQVAAVVGDMLAGRPAIYTTFLAYDEVAHHSGIERPDAMTTLQLVDRQIARIVKAGQAAPRPYRFIVLSDHGQSQGMTFLDRYGITLEDLVSSLSRGDDVQAQVGGEDDAQAYLNASVTEVANDKTFFGRLVGRFSRGKVKDGDLGPDSSGRDEDTGDADGDPIPELSVMASGCLGLINFPREPGRMALERLDDLHPALIEGLAAHPGVGFVLIDSEKHGAMAVGAEGVHFLEIDLVEGEDPLVPFGPNTKDHLLRTHAFPHCPDIMVNSTYWHETDEVAAFEELVGSHGGLGGSQSYPFVLHPADLQWPDEGIIGAENIYHLFKGWTRLLTRNAVQSSGVDSPGSSTLTSTAGDDSAT
ncbi:MAG: phage holin family protein [Thermoleophilia bacterium]|nr:phage holin family protein [Thermoleophilia bacterium]